MTTMILADNAASVTRIECPEGELFAQQSGYRVWNRGKRSAMFDLSSDDGRATFRRMAAAADVIVESFSSATMARLGIDHATLATTNPRLITLSISGYGPLGSLQDRPGYDALVAARTGLFYDQKGRRGTAMGYISGQEPPNPEFGVPDGLVRGADRDGPVFPRTPWPSVGATYLASLGVASALRAREITGRGQHVQTSLLQGALAAVSLNWQRVENPDAPLYWMWPIDSRSIEGLFECADGRWVHHWTVRPSWVLSVSDGDVIEPNALDTNYRDDPDRISMDAEGLLAGMFLQPMLAERFVKFPAQDWVDAAATAGIGMALVRSPEEALADEAFLADGCVVQIDDPEKGPIRHVGPLLEFSRTPGRVAGPSPRFGADTEAVLAESPGVAAVAPAATDPALRHPLAGVRVLDLGLGVAGPFTGRVLADLGADVIKVMALHDTYWAGTHMGLGTNRGKRSIALNLKHPSGREALDRLLATADVFTVNWRPGAAGRLGLDYETLEKRFPRLVYCNTRGFDKGPRSDQPGTDQTAAALTGTEWVDGACDAGNPPLWSRSNMGDTGNALLASIAITAALYDRERTGQGQSVSTSIVNAGLLHTSYCWIDSNGVGADRGLVDAGQYGLSPNYRMYEAMDSRWIFVAAVRPEEQVSLRTTLLGDDATGDEHTMADRLAAAVASRPAHEWFERLDGAGVPVEIIDEDFCRSLFDDAEARTGQLTSTTWAAGVGTFEDIGLLVNLSDTPGVVQRGPSMCGEHTRELLIECGFDAAQIAQMIEDKAVLDAPVNRP